MEINDKTIKNILSRDALVSKCYLLLLSFNNGNAVAVSTRTVAQKLGVTYKVGRRLLEVLSQDNVISCDSTKRGMIVRFPQPLKESHPKQADLFEETEILFSDAHQEQPSEKPVVQKLHTQEVESIVSPPTIGEIEAYASMYAAEHKFTIDTALVAQKWEAYNAMKGWTVKGRLIRDWKGSLRYWILSEIQKQMKNGNSSAYERKNTEAYRVFAKYACRR